MLYEYGNMGAFLCLVSYIFGPFLIIQLFHSPLLDTDDYSQLSATRLAGYLPSRIQRALVE